MFGKSNFKKKSQTCSLCSHELSFLQVLWHWATHRAGKPASRLVSRAPLAASREHSSVLSDMDS